MAFVTHGLGNTIATGSKATRDTGKKWLSEILGWELPVGQTWEAACIAQAEVEAEAKANAKGCKAKKKRESNNSGNKAIFSKVRTP